MVDPISKYVLMNKIALGTVQFGMRYGINSSGHQVESHIVRDILKFAYSNNINFLDTASSYGHSEKILGSNGVTNFNVITKTRHFNGGEIKDEHLSNLKFDFKKSLEHLNTDNVYALLIHNANDLLKRGSDKLIRSLHSIKKQRTVKKIGVSVYDLDQLNFVLENFEIDIIQLPFNIFDRRFFNNGMLRRLDKKGIEVHGRSIFLQGLLLMSREERPKIFNKWDTLWKKWECWLNDNNLTPLDAAVRYAISITEIKKILVGVDSVNQLQQILRTSKGILPEIPNDMFTDDPALLNPSMWELS